MSSDVEAQEEERESLRAIYDTDCEYDPDTCSYKVGWSSIAVLLLLLLQLQQLTGLNAKFSSSSYKAAC
jgi:hypothetical protein